MRVGERQTEGVRDLKLRLEKESRCWMGRRAGRVCFEWGWSVTERAGSGRWQGGRCEVGGKESEY